VEEVYSENVMGGRSLARAAATAASEVAWSMRSCSYGFATPEKRVGVGPGNEGVRCGSLRKNCEEGERTGHWCLCTRVGL